MWRQISFSMAFWLCKNMMARLFTSDIILLRVTTFHIWLMIFPSLLNMGKSSLGDVTSQTCPYFANFVVEGRERRWGGTWFGFDCTSLTHLFFAAIFMDLVRELMWRCFEKSKVIWQFSETLKYNLS